MSRSKWTTRLVFGLALAIGLVGGPAHTSDPERLLEAPQASLPRTLARAVDRAVCREMMRGRVVGAAIGIVYNKRVVYLRGYGFADREHYVPVTDQTLFRWASISKPLTAIAAMQLVESRRLDLKADVRTLIPELSGYPDAITVGQLLSHQSTLPHTTEIPEVLRQAWESGEQTAPGDNPLAAMALFADLRPNGRPGDYYLYSTLGYVLLSAAVQSAAGITFPDFVDSRIAGPLGMTSLQPDCAWRPAHRRAIGYRLDGWRVVPSTRTDVSWKLAGGGYMSTIGDLARFAEALLNDRLVSRETLEQMWTPQRDILRRKTKYGLGFEIEDDTPGHRRVGHAGAQEAARCRMSLYPDEGLGIVVLTNSEHADTHRLVQAVRSALKSQPNETHVPRARAVVMP